MATEVWCRNPDYYVKECLEVGVQNIVWDQGYLYKRSIDPSRFMELYYGNLPYRMLVIDSDQTYELRPDYTLANPYATYPSWAYGDEVSILEELMEKNSSDTAEHRVVITDLPEVKTGVGRKFFRVMREMQDEYPDCILHVHGIYSFRVMFGMGFGSVDIDARTSAKKGSVYMPTGKEVKFERAAEEPQWVTLLGFQPHDLAIPRNRCMYNIKSAQWAGRHFLENVRFKHKGFAHINPDDPTAKPVENHLIFTKRKKAQEGDKFLCDMCSLQTSCKYFRTGAICAVPDSEPQPLAEFFKTRDSDTIIEGLGTLLAAQTRRAEKGLVNEEENDKLDPEVTKIINGVFDRGVALAKLVNPALAKPGLQINVGAGVQQGPPQQLAAQVVQQLVARGIPLESITEDMVKSILAGDTEQRAIDTAAAYHAAS